MNSSPYAQKYLLAKLDQYYLYTVCIGDPINYFFFEVSKSMDFTALPSDHIPLHHLLLVAAGFVFFLIAVLN